MTGPLCYIGGKNRLARKIIELLPEHTTYVEVFGGGGQVLFRKPPSGVEVLNDLDGELVNFFRVCQSHYQELLRYLRFVLVSRQWFDMLYKGSPENMTDVQRAARYFYLQRNCYAGLVVRKNYIHHVSHIPNYNVKKIPEIIEATHRRLENVQIECLPYEQILEKFDRPATLFFLDPPYWNRKLYKFNFEKEDFMELERKLWALKGKFLLTLNDEPEVRDLFSKFAIQPVQLAYSAQRKKEKRFPELIITNY